MDENNSSEQRTEKEIGRLEKAHLYFSLVLWLVIISLIVGFIVYVSVGMAMMK